MQVPTVSHANPRAFRRPLATPGDRLLGQLLDALIPLGLLVLGAVPGIASRELAVLTIICAALAGALYLLLADGMRGGQSFGKRLMRMAVVDAATGRPCSMKQSFVRNVILLALGVLDSVFIFGRNHQRLGDRAAGTVVIKVLE